MPSSCGPKRLMAPNPGNLVASAITELQLATANQPDVPAAAGSHRPLTTPISPRPVRLCNDVDLHLFCLRFFSRFLFEYAQNTS